MKSTCRRPYPGLEIPHRNRSHACLLRLAITMDTISYRALPPGTVYTPVISNSETTRAFPNCIRLRWTWVI